MPVTNDLQCFITKVYVCQRSFSVPNFFHMPSSSGTLLNTNKPKTKEN